MSIVSARYASVLNTRCDCRCLWDALSSWVSHETYQQCIKGLSVDEKEKRFYVDAGLTGGKQETNNLLLSLPPPFRCQSTHP